MSAGNPQAVLSALSDVTHRIHHAARDMSVLVQEREELVERARALDVDEKIIQQALGSL